MTPLTRNQIEALVRDTTEGPWGLGDGDEVYAIDAYRSVAMVCLHQEGRANARLIAAAPDLAAAALLAWTEDGRLCQDVMLELVEHNGRFVRVAADALERAEAAEAEAKAPDGRLWKDVAEEAAGQIAYLMEPSEAEKDRDELTVALATERARREACEAALSLAWDWINNEGVMDRIDRRAMEGGVVEAISAALSPAKE